MEKHRSTICLGCWQHMHVPIALKGPLSWPFRMFGIKASRMNPNTCTICENNFTTVMKARNITTDATVLFADLRGYTALSQTLPPEGVQALLDAFYDECGEAIWRFDGLLNKTLGDAVMAIFNFPLLHEDHAAKAVQAARAILAGCARRQAELAGRFGLSDADLGVGIGIDTGMTAFGEFGTSHRDLTAIGTVVNRAARAQSAARPGEILVTRAVLDRTGALLGQAREGLYQLKGFAEPVSLYNA